MSQLLFRIHHNPEVGPNASEEMESPARARGSKQARSVLLPSLLYGLPPEGETQMKGGSSHFKRSGLKVYLPTSKDSDKEWVLRLQVI